MSFASLKNGPLPTVEDHSYVFPRMALARDFMLPRSTAIYVPGGGGLSTSWQEQTSTNPASNIVPNIVDRFGSGRRLLSLPSNWTWGNQTMVDRINALIEFAESNYPIVGPYHFVGVSMGTLCSCNYAVRFPERVASLSLCLPLANPQEMLDDGILDPYPAIVPPDDAQAYGGDVPDEWNPRMYAPSLRGTPITCYYSPYDTICLPEEALAFGADAGANMVAIGDSGGILPGHNLNNFDAHDLAAWLLENDAGEGKVSLTVPDIELTTQDDADVLTQDDASTLSQGEGLPAIVEPASHGGLPGVDNLPHEGNLPRGEDLERS